VAGTGTVIRVYAETLLEIAREQDQLDRIVEEIGIVRGLLRDAPRFHAFFSSPRIEASDKKGVLRAALGNRLSEETLRFLELVIDRDRQDLLDEILDEFGRRVSELRNQQVLEVASAVPLDEDLRGRLRQTFARATGREIVLEESVDPSLLGGVVVQMGDTRIDGSVQARLQSLRERMLQAARADAAG
jgi:F-type H+-transporting ATPase subunit delta